MRLKPTLIARRPSTRGGGAGQARDIVLRGCISGASKSLSTASRAGPAASRGAPRTMELSCSPRATLDSVERGLACPRAEILRHTRGVRYGPRYCATPVG